MNKISAEQVTPRRPSIPNRKAEALLIGEQLAALAEASQTMTKLTAKVAGRIVNDVLHVGTYAIPQPSAVDPDPLWNYAAGVVIGSVKLRNLGTHAMTVVGRAADGYVPTGGVGVWVVPANSEDIFPMGTRTITVYGTAGDQFCVALFSAGLTPTT